MLAIQEHLPYFSQPGPLTNFGEQRDLSLALPVELPALVDALQHLTLHIFWQERYGIKLDEVREAEVQLRPCSAKLKRLLELDPRSLDQPRPLEQRLLCNCRDISVLFAAILRARGVPARARCGFGTYITPGRYVDHWMTEVWDGAGERWRRVDAQLDALQRGVLKIDFDPLDMPEGKFVLAGDAWRMCRAGHADPDLFGIFQWHGWDFIRGNVFRDLLALNKVELLPWDSWGLLNTPFAECTPEQQALVDEAAHISAASDAAACHSFYQRNPDFQAPKEWLG